MRVESAGKSRAVWLSDISQLGAPGRRGRKGLRLGLRIEPRQDRLERSEPGRERVAICVDRGPNKSSERVALVAGKFNLHFPLL